MNFLPLAALAVVAAACGGGGAPAGPAPAPPPPPADGVAVQAWVTTADGSRLLAREPLDVTLRAGPVDATLPTIDVDTTRTYQRMIGYGAAFTDASTWLIQTKLSAERREALLRDLFGRDAARSEGIGLSFTRVTMGASDFSRSHYSYADLPPGQADPTLARFSLAPDSADKLPVLRAARAVNPQLFLVASPWSPPAWMKTTNSLVRGTLKEDMYGPFTDYFVRFVQGYAAAGVTVQALTIQNEPDFEPADYPGMRLSPAQRARAIALLGPKLQQAGLATQIWDWDHNWDKPEQPLGVLADAAARPWVQGVAWHCYAGQVSAQGTVRAAHPDKDVYFTECSGGAWAPSFADNLKWNVSTLVIGAVRQWARGVAMWNLALDENAGPYLGGCTNCRGVVTINTATGTYTRNVEYFALGHASKFVRPGAVRVESASGVQGLESVAFRHDDGAKALVVLNGSAAARTFNLRVGSRVARYTLPAGAVVTFAWT